VPSRGFDGQSGDPVEHLTTQQAMDYYNATRLDWVYTTNATFVAAVHARGVSAVTLAMNANLPDHGASFGGGHKIGRTKNVLGQSLSAPWMPPGQFRPDSPNYGCVNAPEYRSIAFAYADSLLAAGGDAIQHDDPAMNGEVVNWSNGNLTASGCYCDHCMAKFTDTLLATLNATQRAKYGVRDHSWSYRQWLLARPLPLPHETPDSSALRKMFVDFQKDSVEDYIHALRDHLLEGTSAKGEPNVTISANNGGHWNSPYQLFDYGMGELEFGAASPSSLYHLFVSNVPPGKQQVLTMPKSSNVSYWYSPAGTRTIRAAIAMAYSLGGNMFIPWDIYLPVPAADYTPKTGRYYGAPVHYADLFSFIRGGAKPLLERDDELALPLPLALSTSSQPSAQNYKLMYTGANGTTMGKRYRFVGEPCPECPGQHPTITGNKTEAMTLMGCEADCDALVASDGNASACLGVYYDGEQCSMLSKLVVTDTGMQGVSYLRTGPPHASPPAPPEIGDKELLATSDAAIIAIGRRTGRKTGWTEDDASAAQKDSLTLHIVDTRGLPSVSNSKPKTPLLNLVLSNHLAGHRDCPDSLRMLKPDGPPAGVEISRRECASGGNLTTFSLDSPVPWAIVVAEWLPRSTSTDSSLPPWSPQLLPASPHKTDEAHSHNELQVDCAGGGKFSTLSAARDKIRRRRQVQQQPTHFRVRVRGRCCAWLEQGGDHLLLQEQDSNIDWIGDQGAIITGAFAVGRELALLPASHTQLAQRLRLMQPMARSTALHVSLHNFSAHGKTAGQLSPRTFPGLSAAIATYVYRSAPAELLFAGTYTSDMAPSALHLPRFPDLRFPVATESWAPIANSSCGDGPATTSPCNVTTQRAHFDLDLGVARTRAWAAQLAARDGIGSVYTHGLWGWNWADTHKELLAVGLNGSPDSTTLTVAYQEGTPACASTACEFASAGRSAAEDVICNANHSGEPGWPDHLQANQGGHNGTTSYTGMAVASDTDAGRAGDAVFVSYDRLGNGWGTVSKGQASAVFLIKLSIEATAARLKTDEAVDTARSPAVHGASAAAASMGTGGRHVVAAGGGRRFGVKVGWIDPPVAIAPIVNSWHDTAQGTAGNPRHDSVYPPSEFDIVDALNERRRELRSPFARMFSETNLVYDWPNSTRKTIVGPASLPPNTSETCRTLFPACGCCPRADCSCCAGQIAATTSWDFAALDIQVAALQGNTAFPDTNIMQFTGNVEPWWWFANCTSTRCPCGSALADPTGAMIAEYHSRILDWYTKGGFTDELGAYHHSGYNFSFGYLELMNEVDGHCNIFIGTTAVERVRHWITIYDASATLLKANHPTTKLIGLCTAGQHSDDDSVTWRTFLNRSEHAPGTPWPIDGVAFHSYIAAAKPPTWQGWSARLVRAARGAFISSTAAARAIKEVSPATKVFMDEVGILLGCDAPFNVSATLGVHGSLSSWWNVQSVIWAMYVMEMGAAGVDMLGASQFVGWTAGPPGTPVGIPAANANGGTPFQPQVTAGGNCAEMSMVDWTTGNFNSRSWSMKMIIDAMGHGDKEVLVTNVTRDSVPPPPPDRTNCKPLTRLVNMDMAGGNICAFNMSGPKWPQPSFEACGAACCADPRCDHFTTIDGDPPWQFADPQCQGEEAPCAKGGFCCYFKDRTTHTQPQGGLYKNGSIISGATTPSQVPPSSSGSPVIYARGFRPAGAVTWPGGQTAGVLLANTDAASSHTISLPELRVGDEVWSVEHGVSGSGAQAYARDKVTVQGSLVLAPLVVAFVFPTGVNSSNHDPLEAYAAVSVSFTRSTAAVKTDDRFPSPAGQLGFAAPQHGEEPWAAYWPRRVPVAPLYDLNAGQGGQGRQAWPPAADYMPDPPLPPATFELPSDAVNVSDSGSLESALSKGQPAGIVLSAVGGVYSVPSGKLTFDAAHSLFSGVLGATTLRLTLVYTYGGPKNASSQASTGAQLQGLRFAGRQAPGTIKASGVHVISGTTMPQTIVICY
jgi:hypothetical protein